jgi:hypothetical protein
MFFFAQLESKNDHYKKEEKERDMKEMKGLVKFGIVLVCMVIWVGCATEIRVAPRHDPPPPPPAGRIHIGPLFVEDLDLIPATVFPGEEVLFKARLRNEGSPLRTNIRIQDRDQVVTQIDDIFLPRGGSDLLFPSTRYQFQRSDHCFIVIVDVERTHYRVDAAREFCARPRGRGWTLRP